MDWADYLQKLFTIMQRLDATVDDLERERQARQQFESAVLRQIRELEKQAAEISERLVRVETFRDADRAHLNAEISRFKLEVERVQLIVHEARPTALPAYSDEQHA